MIATIIIVQIVNWKILLKIELNHKLKPKYQIHKEHKIENFPLKIFIIEMILKINC